MPIGRAAVAGDPAGRNLAAALEAMPVGSLVPVVPQISAARAVRAYDLGSHEALLLDDVRNLGCLSYPHVLVMFEKGQPRLVVAAEVDEFAPYLTIFDDETHHWLGWSHDWAELEPFAEEALQTARAWLRGDARNRSHPDPHERYAFLVEELDIGKHAYGCLKRAGLQTVGDVIQRSRTGLRALPGITDREISRVTDAVNAHGLGLWPEPAS